MIIYVLRRHNDIDHLAPVIYRMAKDKDIPMISLCMDPLCDIENDYRLKFLRDKCKVKLDFIYRFHQPSFWHRVVSAMICVRKNNILLRIYLKYLHGWIYERIARPYFFNEKWAVALYDKNKVSAVVFDYAKMHQMVTAPLVRGAVKCGIPTISIPHGLKIWPRETIDRDKPAISSFLELLPFDYFIVSNGISREIYHHNGEGMPAEKIHVLGSTRYCPEWTEICRDIFPEYKSAYSEDENKLKIVYFEGGDRFIRDNRFVIRDLQRINDLDFVSLIVQPKTRNSRLPFNKLKDAINVDFTTPAFSLCKWADVVITGITSVFMEAFCQGNALIFPKYLHMRPTIFEERKVGWIVDSYGELERALKTLKEKPDFRPYSKEDVDKFLVEMVLGGGEDRDVLSEYKDFILSVSGYSPQKKDGKYAEVSNN